MTHLTCEALIPLSLDSMSCAQGFNHFQSQLEVFPPFKELYDKVAHLAERTGGYIGEVFSSHCCFWNNEFKKNGPRDEYIRLSNCFLDFEISCQSKESRQQFDILNIDAPSSELSIRKRIASCISYIAWGSEKKVIAEAPLSSEPFQVRVRVSQENDSTENLQSFSCHHDGKDFSCKKMAFIEPSLKDRKPRKLLD